MNVLENKARITAKLRLACDMVGSLVSVDPSQIAACIEDLASCLPESLKAADQLKTVFAYQRIKLAPKLIECLQVVHNSSELGRRMLQLDKSFGAPGQPPIQAFLRELFNHVQIGLFDECWVMNLLSSVASRDIHPSEKQILQVLLRCFPAAEAACYGYDVVAILGGGEHRRLSASAPPLKKQRVQASASAAPKLQPAAAVSLDSRQRCEPADVIAAAFKELRALARYYERATEHMLTSQFPHIVAGVHPKFESKVCEDLISALSRDSKDSDGTDEYADVLLLLFGTYPGGKGKTIGSHTHRCIASRMMPGDVATSFVDAFAFWVEVVAEFDKLKGPKMYQKPSVALKKCAAWLDTIRAGYRVYQQVLKIAWLHNRRVVSALLSPDVADCLRYAGCPERFLTTSECL